MKPGVATLVNEFTAAGSTDTAIAVARLAGLVAETPRVAAALTRSDLPLANKTGLVADLGSLDERSSQLIAKVCDHARHSHELAAMLLSVAAKLAFAGNDDSDRVENELYTFGSAVRTNTDLRQTLGAPGVSSAPKQRIVDELLAAKASATTLALLKAAVAVHEGRDMDRVAFDLSDQAAESAGRSVAHVTTAVELDEDRRNSLAAAVQRLAGKPVQTRFDVSPKIVGSVVVRIGDDVYDGSVSHRLDQARQKLVGAR